MVEDHIRFREVYEKLQPAELVQPTSLAVESWLRQGGVIVEFVLNAGRARVTPDQEAQAQCFTAALREWGCLTDAYRVIGVSAEQEGGDRIDVKTGDRLLVVGSVGIEFATDEITTDFGRRQVLGDIGQTPGICLNPLLSEIA